MPILKCKCPIYCVYCGRRRSRGAFGIGHYCKTENCQNQRGFDGCDYTTRNPTWTESARLGVPFREPV